MIIWHDKCSVKGFCKICVLKNLAKSIGKNLRWSLFYSNSRPRSPNLLKNIITGVSRDVCKILQLLLRTFLLTLSWRGPLSYRNQSIDLQSKSTEWFLYDNGLRHERVKRSCCRVDYKKHSIINIFHWRRLNTSSGP